MASRRVTEPVVPASGRSAGGWAAELRCRLESRRGELEAAFLTRVYGIADPTEVGDPMYLDGMRGAVAAATDYALGALEHRERLQHVPVQLLAQARAAARNGVGLDTVLRRYFGGYSLLGNFILEEASRARVPAADLKELLQTSAAHLDVLLKAVSEEHRREAAGMAISSEWCRVERIEHLLAGELVDVSEFGYDFEGRHLGLVGVGAETEVPLRAIAARLDRRLLLVRRDHDVCWAWFGGLREIDGDDLAAALSTLWPGRAGLALGEPAEGLDGWRLTHRQANAVLRIAARRPGAPVRYREMAILASVVEDEVLVRSLRQIYLAPIEQRRDGGALAKETLRAYFATHRNVSSAAAMLNLSRQAVTKRLRAVEEALGCPIESCGVELEAALRIEEIEAL